MRIDEIKAELKAKHPTLQRGDDNAGYTQIADDEYESIIESWAQATYQKEVKTAEKEAERQTKISAYEKLGLTAVEIEALLPTPKPIVRNLGGN